MAKLQKEKFDQPMEFDQYLGHMDLEQHPLWGDAWVGQDQEAFETVLHEMGADLRFGYEFTMCLHRSRTNNKVEYGMRVAFRERTDTDWMDNMMSTSDIVRNTHNSLRATGMRMGLNEETPLNEAMMEQAAKLVTLADIKVDLSKDKE